MYVDAYKTNAFYGQGNGSIWLGNPICSDNEERLLDCDAQPDGEHSCEHDDDIGVECSGILIEACLSSCTIVYSRYLC